MTAFRLLAVCLAVAGLGVTAEPPTYRLERLNLNVVPPKSRINGPSLVRLPEWLRHKDRLSITVHGMLRLQGVKPWGSLAERSEKQRKWRSPVFF